MRANRAHREFSGSDPAQFHLLVTSSRLVGTAVLVILLGCQVVPVCGGEPSLESALAALQSWQRRLSSVRIKARRSSTAQSSPSLTRAGVKSAIIDHDWGWDDTGRFYDKAVLRHDGKFISRSLRMADLMEYFDCEFQKDALGGDFPVRVSIHENTLEFTGHSDRDIPLWGLWDNAARTWLGKRIENVTTARVTDDGLLEIPGDEIGLESFHVRLDPEHGYLPISAEHTDGISKYRVEKFLEAEPNFWFPLRGTILSRGSDEDVLESWEIQEVELNAELPDSLLRPPIGDETEVLNFQMSTPSRHSPHGQRPEQVEQEERNQWGLWLLLIALLYVTLGLWFTARSGEPRKD